MAKNREVKLYNCSRQMLPLQIRHPKADFYRGEQQVRLAPGKEVRLIYNFLREDQILNLQKKGMLKVTFDSSAE